MMAARRRPRRPVATCSSSRTANRCAFFDAVVGGRSVGTPGTLKLLEVAHTNHGKLPWPRLFERSIELARDGFAVSPRLAGMLGGDRATRLRTYQPTRDYFFPAGEPLAAGQRRANPAFAATLEALAENGTAPFYRGAIAQNIVDTVRGAPGNPGRLSLDDLASYRVIVREPVCHPYRAYVVCGMGPPSSGALTVGQILGILEHFDIASLGPGSVEAWHLFAEASKLAYADRGLYMADSDFVRMPILGPAGPELSHRPVPSWSTPTRRWRRRRPPATRPGATPRASPPARPRAGRARATSPSSTATATPCP